MTCGEGGGGRISESGGEGKKKVGRVMRGEGIVDRE